MKLFLVRHGDANAEFPEGLRDDARALTSRARTQVASHFSSLAKRMPEVELVLTSPLVRAVQTAQILSTVLKHEGLLKVHRALLPDMPVGAMETLIHEHAGENIALVGHQPSVGAVAAHLLGLQAFPKPVQPGTVIGLEMAEDAEPGTHAKLLFYAPPGQPLSETL